MGAVFLFVGLLATPLAKASTEYLAPEAAFRFSAQMIDAQNIQVVYEIADGYYMYRDRFHFEGESVAVGDAIIPAGKIKFDENFQKNVETYRGRLSIRLPVTAAAEFTLIATAQGCADQGLCYPPMTSKAKLNPTLIGKTADPAPSTSAQPIDSQISSSLQSRNLLKILPLFFLLGIGLAFTPCMFPMYPILSSIIVGDRHKVHRGRGLLLSFMYALGMTLVYTGMGIAAGLLGEGLAASLQNPWVLSICAAIMVGLSLSMFDLYQLQLPASWQTGLIHLSGRRSGGKLIGVFVMGAISALVVGPCVAPPLAGALLYLSQSRDVLIGGSGLFALGVGMSVPLLLIGASAGTVLPRAGKWMNEVKRLFGILMLGTAWWMLSSLLPGVLAVLGWAALGIAYGAYLIWREDAHWSVKAMGLVFAALGLLQLMSAATGGKDALSPMSQFRGVPESRIQFTRVRSSAELDAALANLQGKSALLDFYADWCVSCIEMEKGTFTDPAVKAQMDKMVLLQVDVTANNADDKALLKRFNLFGPPGIIMFDRQGREIPHARVIGYSKPTDFLPALHAAD
ncbi:protein-disulfide reductase DsbD [Herbaspirillum sp. RTI4]|uniref:protein-disulfide reductase DsbD n=1 Tax=Herbaspirillum sp. RTI4 TaxID=3048640 RepID=UPI002AB4D5F7|nr:protein-disulfide reductase DsbD [Herbaspirillum sp. RTI4]MDY7577359.1 protein-disulfide reductase DsbD [Herbaspirillum sp. RTI4]MEA9982413.1 protein-disulfide reductase DsbD [Herbaspirillum sp. RTI4]